MKIPKANLTSVYIDDGTTIATDGYTLFTCNAFGVCDGAYSVSAGGVVRSLKTQSGEAIDVRGYLSGSGVKTSSF